MDSAETRRPVIATTTPEPPFDERLDRELDQALYTDCRAIADWLATTYGVR